MFFSYRDLKEHAYASKYMSHRNSSPYDKPKLAHNEEEEIDLVPKRRAPPPPTQSQAMPISSTTTHTEVEIRIKSPVRRPKEPPPPTPNLSNMGSSFNK